MEVAKYPKIQTIFKRGEKKKIIEGDWTLPEFEYLQNNQWTMTEKVDGTNIRIAWHYLDDNEQPRENPRVTFDGRTENAQLHASLVNHLVWKFNANTFKEFEHDMCLYGEGFGKGIQGQYGKAYSEGFLKGESHGFILFDIKIGHYWLKREDIKDIGNRLNIPVVPVVNVGTLADAIQICKDGFQSELGNITAEGLVLKPVVEMRMRNGERIIAKLKHKDFK